jgi:hypothetical protein
VSLLAAFEGLLAVGVGEGLEGVLFAASVGRTLRGVLRAASVGRTLSPSSSVVVLLRSDFLAYYC